jgi:hypothetical protein
LNLGELEMRLDRFGLRIRKDFPVSDDIHSFLIERARPLETATVGEA